MNEQLKQVLAQQLRDVHSPDPVTWWPLAIGWWFVIALGLSALIISLVKLTQYRRRNAYRKIAIKELDQHFAEWQAQQRDSDYLQSANAVIKRACSHFNDNAVSLSGPPWIALLNSYCDTHFSNDVQAALTLKLYQEKPNSDIDKVHHEIRTWLVRHSAKQASQTRRSSYA